MQPMSHDVRLLYIWTLDREAGFRAGGDGKPVYTRSDVPVRVYMSLAERVGEQTPTGYADTMEIPAYINGPAEVSVGDCLGTSAERRYRVAASIRMESPYEQTQLRLREVS